MEEVLKIGGKDIGMDECVNTRTAAKILGVSPRTVQQWGAEGFFGVYRLGARKNVYWVRELVEWCEKKRAEVHRQGRMEMGGLGQFAGQ